jgi:hypothetical protein
MALKGGRELRNRIKALRLVFKDVGRKWGDAASRKMRPRVPVKTGRLRRSFTVRASQRRAQVRAHYTAFFVDAGTKAHRIEPRKAKVLRFEKGPRTIFAKRVDHPRVRARPFRAESARQALSETAGAEALIEAWNRAA